MKAHAYGNTVSDDLWREVEKAAGTPVLEIAHQFTLQPGVPMIRVERATCAAGNTTVELVQAEFTKDRPDKRPLSWRVPVIASTLGNDARVRTLVSNGRATMTVPGCGPLILNPGQSGYYRTLYSPAQFSAIRNHFAQLAPIDQLGLMKDALAQGLAGLQPASDYLGLVRATPVDADPQVWGEIAGGLYGLSEYYEGDAARQGRFRAFAIARLSPVFAKVGWTAQAGEASPVTILRSDLIRTLGALGDPAVVAEVRRRHAAQASDPGAVPTALRKAILAVLARHADAKTWDQLHVAAKAEKTPLVRDEFYSLLSQAEDARLAQRALELALTDEPGATNSAGMVAAVANSHPDLAFDFAVAHLARLDQRVDSTSRSRYYPSLGSNSLEARMIGKIKLYSTAHIAAGSRRSADTVIANITYRIKVRKERLPAIDAWLQSNGG